MQILSDDELHQIIAKTVQQVLGSAKPSQPAVESPKPKPGVITGSAFTREKNSCHWH